MPGLSELPGTIAPEGFEGRLEWVPQGVGFLSALALRLGSETRGRRASGAEKLVVAVLPPLRHFLAADTWEALVEELPWSLRGMVRSAEAHLGGPVPRLEGRGRFVRFVADKVLHPPPRAAHYVLAVLGALKASIPAALAEAVARELPPDLADLWRRAR